MSNVAVGPNEHIAKNSSNVKEFQPCRPMIPYVFYNQIDLIDINETLHKQLQNSYSSIHGVLAFACTMLNETCAY